MAKKPPVRKAPVRAAVSGPTESAGSSRLYFLIWAGIALLLILLRLPFLDIALERDEASYAYIGKRALEGLAPYRDFYEMKPPLLFYSYAFLIAVFGYSTAGLHIALLVVNLLSTFFVYLISRRLMNPTAAVVAAAAYIVLAFNPMVSGLWLVSEHVLMAVALGGVYAFLRGLEQPRWLWLAGILLAGALLIRQVAGVFGLWAGIVLLVRHLESQTSTWKGLLRQGGMLAAGAALPIAIVALLLSVFGVWPEFRFWMIDYPEKYMSGVSSNGEMDVFGFQWKRNTQTYLLYWIAGVLGLVSLLVVEKKWLKKSGLLVLALLAFATILPGKRYYGHYWLQFFPFLAMGVGAGAYAVQHWLKGRMGGAVTAVFLVISLSHLLTHGENYFQVDQNQLVRKVYAGNPFDVHRQLAKYLQPRLRPEDQLLVLGSEPQFYIYTGKKSPTRHFYTGFTSRNIPEARQWQQEILADFRQSQPAYVVFSTQRFSWMMKPDSDQTLYREAFDEVLKNYTPIACADFISEGETKMIFDAEAASYQPVSREFVMILQRKS